MTPDERRALHRRNTRRARALQVRAEQSRA